MGRPVTIRASYGADASFLIRLSKAVSLDERRPHDWRDKTTKMINDLAIRLIDVPGGDEKSDKSKSGKKS